MLKRVISFLLALIILMSSGLLDVMAWAAEASSIPGENPNTTESMVELGEFSFDFQPMAEPQNDESTGLEYVQLNSTYCEVTGYTGDAVDLVIPETLGGYTVRSIGEGAFFWNEDLENVTLPETVERICAQAFEGCSRLEQINIPDCVVELGDWAFSGCSRLREFHFPSMLERAGGAVWANCSDLETISVPEGITELQDNLFAESCFREIQLPQSLEKLGSNVFSSCTELESITIPDSVTEIGGYLFEYCESLQTVTLPADLEILPEGTFYYCSDLQAIELPQGLTEICYNAFYGCTRLRTLELPDSVSYIGDYAFADCSMLEQINYPLSLTETGNGIFSGCMNLETFEVPDGVTELPAHIFADCDYLRQIVLPDSLERIGDGAFYSCDSLADIVLPPNLTELGASAFEYCVDLEQIEIPAGITTIAPYTFYFCERLTQVTLPDGLERIEYAAFQDCDDLETITIPDSVVFLGGYVFSFCERLYEINYPMGLQEAEADLFRGCLDLETITVPEGVTGLPDWVFSGCDELETILLPATLTAIGDYAFAGCTELEHITLPENLTELGCNAFEHCDSLREIVIPDGITELPESLFYDCDRLTNVTLPDGMTVLGYGAFSCCRNMTGILLPETLKEISAYCFSDCEKLSAILLPEGLEWISWGAFSNCRSLKEITIPEAVSEIEGDVFWGIEDLVICCHLNSHAAAYAVENDIAIVERSGASVSDLYELDHSRCAYQIDYDGLSASGSLSMNLRYYFKDRSWAEPQQLMIRIPASTQLLEQTLTLDGNTCTDYTYESDMGMLCIPVEESEGVVRFSIKPLSYERTTSFATVAFIDEDDEYRTEVVGVVYADLPIITLSAREETSETTITATGVTMPGNTVVFSINGTEVGQTVANKAGNYTAELPLPDPSNGKQYNISADTTDSEGNAISAQTLVIYRSGTPVITDVVMEHAGNIQRMEDMAGVRPVVTFVPGEPFRFEVYVDQHDSIDTLLIVSTRSNQRKVMKAVWDEELGAYVADGFFDPEDESYVPGTITIEYVRKDGKVSFQTGYDFTSDESLNLVPDDWKNANVIVNENTAERQDVIIEKPDGSVSVHVTTTTQQIPQGITQNNAADYGFTYVLDDDGNGAWIRYHEDNGVPQIDVLNWVDDVMFSQVVEVSCDALGVSTDALTVLELVKTLGETVSYDMQFQQMRNDIINSNMSWAEKNAALEQLDNAQKLNAMLGITRITGTLVCAAVGSTLCLPAAIVLAVGWGLMDHYLGYLQESNLYYKGSKSLLELIFGWVIDPSGYVYDQADGKRLSGVTVTAYWVPYDDCVDNFWGAVPDDSEYGQLWDAGVYSQMNPLVTDEEGRYAWDVPEGWWRVEYRKEGYGTVWSDWMPVPPPQTEVNIGMVAQESGHDHSYESATTEPTCTEQGYTTYTCACGNSYVDDYVEALGHNYADGTCTVCGDAEAVVIASGWSGATQWNLTDDGLLTVYGSGNMKNYGYTGGQPWLNKGVDITAVVIEEGINAVGSGAFMNLTTLETVSLPNSMTKMGEAAFYGTGLTSVEIPASLWTIQPYTFKNCTALEDVTFHEGNLQKISDGAFYGTALTELVLPDCLDILDVYAFKGCSRLTSIIIGSGLTELREAVFYGTAIPTIEIPDGITKIGPYAFKNCVELETVDLPESLISVGEASFYACTALESLVFPDSVTTIGNYAFRKCAAIESLNFGSGLMTIGECSFYGCTGLTEIVIPDKVTTIKPYAFKTCTGLTSVTLGSSVDAIGEGAFNTCTGLKTIVFPASLTDIGDYCFSGSTSLWKLTFQGDAPAIGTGAFKGMNAYAYYPSGNSTYTSANMLNYGGKITWKAN